MSNITTGLYQSSAQAEDAVQRLKQAGVPLSDIRVIASHLIVDRNGIFEDPHSRAPEGIAIGAASGGTVGAIIAGVTATSAIAAGTAGLGLIAAGPIAAAIAGAGAGAAAGSVIGGMVGAAVPEAHQQDDPNAIGARSVLVGVRTKDEPARAAVEAALTATGAQTIA
jgi:hypothetical protein